MTYPAYGGGHRVIEWFDLLTYGEGLKKRRLAERYEAKHPSISITLTAAGRSTLMSTQFFVRVDTRRKQEMAAQAKAKGIPVAMRDNIPSPLVLMRVIVEVLYKHGNKKQGKLLTAMAPLLKYPIDLAYAGQPVEGGVQARKNFDQGMEALQKAGYVLKSGKSLVLSQLAKVRRKAGKLSLPAVGEVPRTPEAAQSKVITSVPNAAPTAGKSKGKLAHLSNGELVAMWKNAIRVLSEPKKKADHAAAKQAVANVTSEWERRTAEMMAGHFPWPSTDARGGNGLLSFEKVQAAGMLSLMEYRVGRSHGESEPVRRAILKRVFENTLPPAFPKDYMEEWGQNASAVRLQKMAVSIAAFVRNNKRRRNGDYSDAIREWENDLGWLYTVYYVGKLRFATGWPETVV